MEKKRKRQIRNINSELAADMIEIILSKLQFLNLLSCRLVCKAWNDLVLTCKFDSNLSFALISHTANLDYVDGNLHCVDFDPKHLEGMSSVASFSFHPKFSSTTCSISIINSCNGLLSLLITKTRRRRIIPHGVCILNPITNEYIKFPTSKAERAKEYFYGLGFSPKTKQFKIARNSYKSKSTTLVEIFAFGTTSKIKWTPVAVVPFSIEDNGVYFNGALYWFGFHLQHHKNVICRLDIEHEKIDEISAPQDVGDFVFIGVVNGTLYLTLWMQEYEYRVWMMEEDFSWNKAFVVRYPRNIRYQSPIESFQLQLIKACEDGKILCLWAELNLLLYDPKSQTTEVLTDQDVQLKKHMWVHPIDSFNFNSLPKILAGNGYVEG